MSIGRNKKEVKKMGFELESDEDVIEIDFRDKSMKGKLKAGNWKKHMDKVKELLK